jgi:hypothetical protein
MGKGAESARAATSIGAIRDPLFLIVCGESHSEIWKQNYIEIFYSMYFMSAAESNFV